MCVRNRTLSPTSSSFPLSLSLPHLFPLPPFQREQNARTMTGYNVVPIHHHLSEAALTFVLRTTTQRPPSRCTVALFSTLSKFFLSFMFRLTDISTFCTHTGIASCATAASRTVSLGMFFFSFRLLRFFLLTLTAPSAPWHRHRLDTRPSQCGGSHGSTVDNPGRGELWADTTTAHAPATNMG